MSDGWRRTVVEPTLESLQADVKAHSTLLRELETALTQLTARDRVVGGGGAHGFVSGQLIAGQPKGSGGAAVRPELLEPARSGRVGAKSVSGEDNYLAVPELLQQAVWTHAGVDVGVVAGAGVAAKVSTSDGVGRRSSELRALCEATFR
eukprot:jgi/Tetstr1/441620/TSEL_029847.t1